MNLSRLTLLASALCLASAQSWASQVTGKMPAHEYEHEYAMEHRDREKRERRHEREHRTPENGRHEIRYDDDFPGEGDPAGSTTVFESSELFRNKTHFTESFLIETKGTYQAILTDFEFPSPLKESALNITTATETLLTLWGPGTMTFEADPGEYYLSFFAVAGRGHDKGPHAEGNDWHEWDFGGHPPHYGYGNLGQYGIEISMTTSAVPLPAAVWLFSTGLLGITGAGWRRRKASLGQ